MWMWCTKARKSAGGLKRADLQSVDSEQVLAQPANGSNRWFSQLRLQETLAGGLPPPCRDEPTLRRRWPSAWAAAPWSKCGAWSSNPGDSGGAAGPMAPVRPHLYIWVHAPAETRSRQGRATHRWQEWWKELACRGGRAWGIGYLPQETQRLSPAQRSVRPAAGPQESRANHDGPRPGALRAEHARSPPGLNATAGFFTLSGGERRPL